MSDVKSDGENQWTDRLPTVDQVRRRAAAGEIPLVWIAVTLVAFFPLGMYFVWKHPGWPTKTKGIWTGAWAVSFVLGMWLIAPLLIFLTLLGAFGVAFCVIWSSPSLAHDKKKLATGLTVGGLLVCIVCEFVFFSVRANNAEKGEQRKHYAEQAASDKEKATGGDGKDTASPPAAKLTMPVADFTGVNYKAGPNGEPLTTMTQADANFDFPTGKCTTVDVSRSGYRTTNDQFVPHGREVGYYPDDEDSQKKGKLKLELYWFAGKLHGQCTLWYKSGQKNLAFSFKDGEAHGHYQEWHKDGKPALDTHFDNGKEVGTVTKWYSNGQMRSKGVVINDEFEGRLEFWWENGKRGYVRNYKAGKLHGKSESWDEYGRTEGDAEWVNGKPVISKGKINKSTFKQVMAMLAKQVSQSGSGNITYVYGGGSHVLTDAFGEPDSKLRLRNNEEVWTFRCTDGSLALTVLNLADFIVKKVEER